MCLELSDHSVEVIDVCAKISQDAIRISSFRGEMADLSPHSIVCLKQILGHDYDVIVGLVAVGNRLVTLAP